jgi:hypothetical protein
MSLTKVTYSMINGPMVCVTDYGAVCDGVKDDYAAIMSAHDNAPDGATVLVKGACYYTQPLVFTRRLNWVCPGSGDYFKPDVGALNDALKITGGVTAANLQHKINMYSSSTCANALVLDLFWMSTIESRVAVNATDYAFKVIGGLESKFYLKQSVNFATPGGASGLAANHLKIEANTTAPGGPYYTNANEFYVNFAGAVNGVIHDSMSAQGDNTFRGTIQGLSGTPFSAVQCNNMKITELHFEGNPIGSAFDGCTNCSIENVINAASEFFALYSCIGVTVKNYIGGLFIASSSSHTKIINCRIDGDTYTDQSATTEMIGGGVTSTSSATNLQGGGGASPIENFFHNPFIDIWTDGTAAAPDGFAAVAATFAQSTAVVYGLGYGGKSVAVTSTATALGDMTFATPVGQFANTPDARWVSVLTAVYVATGQPDVVVYVFNGTSFEGLATVSTKDAWVTVRGSVLVTAGGTPYIAYAPFDGVSFVAGNFYVGGVSMVNGTSAPKFLIDSGRRLEHVVTSVSHAPAFVGQRAYLSGTGKWYMAKGTVSNADWIILN